MTEKKVIGLLIVIAGAVVALILTGIIYKKVVKKNNNLHTRFLVQMLRFIIVVGAIINGVGVVSDTMSLGTLFFRSSALIVAILGFAAQPAIKTMHRSIMQTGIRRFMPGHPFSCFPHSNRYAALQIFI